MSNAISKDSYVWPERFARYRRFEDLNVYDALNMVFERRGIKFKMASEFYDIAESLTLSGNALNNFIRYAERFCIPQAVEVFNELVAMIGMDAIREFQGIVKEKPAHKPKTKKRKKRTAKPKKAL